MATTKDEIRQAIEARLAAIEQELGGHDALLAERDQLRRALAELQDPPPPAEARDGRSGRRPRGANRDAVLAVLGSREEASAAAIADASGVDRRVIYNLLARMADRGEVARAERDGQALYTLP